MRKLIELNKEWFDKSNEMIVDFVKRGGDAYLKDVSFLNLKRDAYFAISNLMVHLADGRVKIGTSGTSSSDESTEVDPKHMDSFKEEMRSIFERFEEGRNYKNSGFAESVIDLIGRRVHSYSYEFLAKGKIANLEKLMEDLWVNFFELQNTGDTKSDSKRLEALLTAFEKDVNKTLDA